MFIFFLLEIVYLHEIHSHVRRGKNYIWLHYIWIQTWKCRFIWFDIIIFCWYLKWKERDNKYEVKKIVYTQRSHEIKIHTHSVFISKYSCIVYNVHFASKGAQKRMRRVKRVRILQMHTLARLLSFARAHTHTHT